MNLYLYDIGERARKASRFIGHVRAELQRALVAEKASRKLSQQQIATMIGTSRSVINREFMGLENLTLRRVAELAWALGWEIVFQLRKPQAIAAPTIPIQAPQMPPRPANLEPQLNAPALPVIDFKSFATAA
ncbi:MAG TPA: helix-turn-helix transcriptional regulator [Xanthobacteraceae bacterium]|jgi:hypothetical protein|nr:helix-turn-helix transcriptional regulator [Xanthobacteraceae bacterium]